ncbi:MAG: TRAP transporter small permease [Dehalococcoidales bacterium]|nr:TRAP transporter small permease [Dehalococcoidales bacterium]
MKAIISGLILQKGIYRVAQGAAWVSGTAVVIIMCLTASDVFLRYLGHPIKGAMEITEMLLVVLGFLAFGYTQITRKNVVIELVISHLSNHTRAILDMITRLLSLGVYGFMFWGLGRQAWKFVLSPEIAPRGDILSLPFLPFIFIAAAGVFILFLVLIIDFSHSLAQVFMNTGETAKWTQR